MQENRELPSQEYLQECLTYNPETGKLFWKIRPEHHFKFPRACKMWNTRFANKEAFTALGDAGYKMGRLCGKTWFVHRIIFKFVTGLEPQVIDHENGDKLDNTWDNLRNVSQGVNMQNTGKSKRNKSGVTGVSWVESRNKWIAKINKDGVYYYIGVYSELEDAIKARKLKEVEFKFHANHGR